ncbi:phage integrase family protein [Haloactinospora alba]|uniref:Phage integrase family protein n=1 Tax=Haloactinospora alba TaxID=405555 RepID=A0A543NKH9_9ACTN|nr:tyrosine-type recombinase/integrase [Haloactinospora alba]TQN32316.1 phage integrase family protein [Haloactinospora alba]
MQRGFLVGISADLPGSARMELVEGVVHLDPAPAVYKAMLAGWARQQRTRYLKDSTVETRTAAVQRLERFSGQYPWEWGPAEVEEFIADLRSPGRRHPITVSTARGYENSLRLFMDYITDPRYGWPDICEAKFGRRPQQILHEWNTIAHTGDYEGRPGRRPLTYDEVQALFDAADGRAEQIRSRGRKGGLAAIRDAALLKVVYAFGLRRQEARGLDLADLRSNPQCREYGKFGGLYVRYGKSSRGGVPKRRTVLTVPEMDWIVDVLDHYVHEVRPLFGPGKIPALWVTERRSRLSRRSASDAFETARQLAGLPGELDLHALRHSYVTHLVEFDYPERFVSEQVGHSYASTTAIYTGVSDAYRNRLLERSLKERHGELWGASI